MKFEPTDGVLYNDLLDMREWRSFVLMAPETTCLLSILQINCCWRTPEGVLGSCVRGSCALSLLFFSDGKPSDSGNFAEKMKKIPSAFGRRLSITCIGMAEEGEDFSTLCQMVDEANSDGIRRRCHIWQTIS
jgi:hypothetical protein